MIEVWNTVFMVAPWKVKSLVYHIWVTLSSTLVGFVLGTLLGIGLAVAIVHSKLLNKSLMPWIIASQTIPILAIAPMIIVVLGSVGLTGLVPKSIISMYLCFFPVAIGMVKGLTSPDPMQLDLMRTYNASVSQVLWKLRFPAAMPFLFASLKVAVAIALTGAIVGELPTGVAAVFRRTIDAGNRRCAHLPEAGGSQPHRCAQDQQHGRPGLDCRADGQATRDRRDRRGPHC